MDRYLLGLLLLLLGVLLTGVMRRRMKHRATQALLERVRSRRSEGPHVSANVKGAGAADAGRAQRVAD
jgi:hypothetical protein